MVYIREAHPKDGWWFGSGLPELYFKLTKSKASRDITDPKTIEERREVATQCEESLKYGVRTYIDEMDDPVSKAYAAKPTRLYFVGIDGYIKYAGGIGPWGFKPQEFAKAIEDYLRLLPSEEEK